MKSYFMSEATGISLENQPRKTRQLQRFRFGSRCSLLVVFHAIQTLQRNCKDEKVWKNDSWFEQKLSRFMYQLSLNGPQRFVRAIAFLVFRVTLSTMNRETVPTHDPVAIFIIPRYRPISRNLSKSIKIVRSNTYYFRVEWYILLQYGARGRIRTVDQHQNTKRQSFVRYVWFNECFRFARFVNGDVDFLPSILLHVFLVILVTALFLFSREIEPMIWI